MNSRKDFLPGLWIGIIFVFTVWNFNWLQGSHSLDSLFDQLRTEKKDSNHVMTIYEIGWQLKHSDPNRSEMYALEANYLAKELDFVKGLALTTSLLGYHSRTKAEFEKAEKYYLESLEARLILESPLMVSRCYFNLGRLYFEEGQLSQSILAYESSLEALNGLQEDNERAKILNSLGAAFRREGDFKRAAEALEEGHDIRQRRLLISQDRGDSVAFAKSILNLGNLYFDQGNLNKAGEFFEDAGRIFGSLGSISDHARVKNNLGLIFLARLDYKKATSFFHEAIGYYTDLGDSASTAFALVNLGRLHADQGGLDSAIIVLDRALDLFSSLENIEGLAKASIIVGEVFKKKRKLGLAKHHIEKGLKFAKKLSNPFPQIDALNALSEVYEAEGESELAFKYATLGAQYKDSVNKAVLSSIFLTNELERSFAQQEILKSEKELANQRLEKLRLQDQFFISLSIALAILLVASLIVVWQRQRIINSEKQKKIALGEASLNARKIEEILKNQEYKMLVAMAEGQEDERRRISEELHDSLGGLLAAIKLHLKAYEEVSAASDDRILRIQGLMENAIQKVRQISHDLLSGILMEFGLPSALIDLQETIESSGQLDIQLDIFGLSSGERLEFDQEIKIYRMIQELVTNSLKHANPTRIEIQLVKDDMVLNIIVADDGKGFDPDKLKMVAGIGLRTIKARVYELEGSISIDSGMGNGTTISIDLPIKP